MRRTLIFTFLVLSTASYAAVASADLRRSAAACAITENAQVSVSFSGVEMEAANVKGKLDSTIAEIKKLAKESGIDKVVVQSTNYNVSTQNYGSPQSPQFQYSGNIGLLIQPTQKAEEFFVILTKKGHQASLNVNSYQSDGACAQSGE